MHMTEAVLQENKGLARTVLHALKSKGFKYGQPIDTLSDTDCIAVVLGIIKALRDRETMC